MKTTLDLDDALLQEAKVVAARRRTTLKDLITRSLRREIGLDPMAGPAPAGPFVPGPLGLPVLRKRGAGLSTERVRRLLDETDAEDVRRAAALRPRRAK